MESNDRHPILTAHRLSAGYRNDDNTTITLSSTNLSLRRGELVCLLGANGIGKSTLLRTLSGVQRPLSGHIEINGRKIQEYPHGQLSRLISIVYTDRTLAGALTVYELVALGRHPYTGFLGRLSNDDHYAISQAIIAMGITHKAFDHVATLSDGERQKAMIARALAQESPIIILDEPTAFLDVASRIETMKTLHHLAKEKDKAILLSSHDIGQSLALASRLWLLRDDHTIIEGVTEDLVLQGELNLLFSNRQVSFDSLLGDFIARQEVLVEMQLDCDNPRLRRWVENALMRNGIGITEHSCHHAIKADTPTSLYYNGTPANSIEQLLHLILQ